MTRGLGPNYTVCVLLKDVMEQTESEIQGESDPVHHLHLDISANMQKEHQQQHDQEEQLYFRASNRARVDGKMFLNAG